MKLRCICSLVSIVAAITYAVDKPSIKLSTITSLRQDEFILDTTVRTIPGYGNQLTPVVASDGTNFLLVWAEFRNEKLQIFGARMDPNSVLLDTLAIPIATKAETQYAPAVVFGGSYYFVVWEEYHEVFYPQGGYFYPRRIYGSRVSTAGIVIDTNAVLISNVDFDVGNNSRPDVAFDGTNYFVVWQGHRIQGARVSQSGTVLDYPIDITRPNEYGYNPCVEFAGSCYLVAWDMAMPGAPMQADTGQISCARVAANGTLIDTNAIVVSAGGCAKINPEITSDSINYFVVWEDYKYMWDSSMIEICGSRVSQTGVVIDTAGIYISRHVGHQRTPTVSYDGTNYFVTWVDDRNNWMINIGDIYGARVSRSGIIIDSMGIAITKDSALATCDIECYPKVVFGGGCYLAVWQHGIRTRPADYDVFSARVARSGVVVDTSGFAASTQVPGHQYSSASAFDGTNYLVVWNDYHYGEIDTFQWWDTYGYAGIYGIRVSATGAILDSAALCITKKGMEHANPSIAFDGMNYFVVYEGDSAYPYYYEPGKIKGRRVEQNGHVIDTMEITIAANGFYFYPTLAFDGTNYLVVYYDFWPSPKIVCRRVSPGGVVLDPTDIVIASNLPYQMAYGPSAIGFDGGNYMIVWASGEMSIQDIFCARVSPSGVVLDSFPIVISNAQNTQWYPAIAFDGTNYLVVWEDRRNASGCLQFSDIYGARVTSGGAVLDPQGIPICTAFNDQECPDVGFDGANYVVVWQDLRDTTSYSIYGAKVSPSGNVLNTYQIVTDPYDQMEPVITRGNNDQMLITYTGWTSMINSHRAHTMRIWGRMYPFPGVEEGSGMPASGRMLSLNAYPNPCRERIEIKWIIPRTNEHLANKDDRKLMIYDVTGRVVKDLSRLLAPNSNLNQTTWDMTDGAGRRLSAGVYFVRLEIPGKELVEKIVLLK